MPRYEFRLYVTGDMPDALLRPSQHPDASGSLRRLAAGTGRSTTATSLPAHNIRTIRCAAHAETLAEAVTDAAERLEHHYRLTVARDAKTGTIAMAAAPEPEAMTTALAA